MLQQADLAPQPLDDSGPQRSAAGAPVVRHLRQVLLWPLRLISTAADDSEQRRAPWQLLRELERTAH